MWSHWFATGTYSIEKISYERKSKYQVQLLNDDYLTVVPITTQQVRCFCKHIHIWNSIGVRVKKGVSARMPKKDWVSSEALWSAMNIWHECSEEYALVRLPYIQSAYYINRKVDARAFTCKHRKKNRLSPGSCCFSYSSRHTQTHWNNLFSFGNTTLFQNSFHLGLWKQKTIEMQSIPNNVYTSKFGCKAAIKHLHLPSQM